MYSCYAGGLKAAAKRSVFGEVNNNSSYMRNAYDDSSIGYKNPYGVIGDKSTLRKENNKPAGLLRPAQRPSSMTGLKGILGHAHHATYASTATELGNTRKVLNKNTTVYKDTSPILDSFLNGELTRKHAEAAPMSIASLNLPQNEWESLVAGLPKPKERKRLSRYASTFARLEAEKEARKVSPPVEDIRGTSDVPDLRRTSHVANLHDTIDVAALRAASHIDDFRDPDDDEDLIDYDKLYGRYNNNDFTKPKRDDIPVSNDSGEDDNSLAQRDDITVSDDNGEHDDGFAKHDIILSDDDHLEDDNGFAKRDEILSDPPVLQHDDLSMSVKKALSATTRQILLEAANDEEFMRSLVEDDDDGYVTAHSYKSRGDYTTGAVTTELLPEMTSRSRREVEAATRFVEASKTVEEVEEETWDTSMVAEYDEDIFAYLRELEIKLAPSRNYMETQAEIQWSMRAVLMDWLVQVHQRFGLLPETLFLCANFIDRFLSAKVVSLGKLQLVGATALFVAAKYEEINCPSVQEIVYMVDSGYTVQEILKAERFMLGMLQFELGWPGPMSFLRRISKADDYDLDTRTLAKYFLEITLMDERFLGSPPSFLAAGAHCLARQMLKKGEWTASHVHYSGYSYSQIEYLMTLLAECCENPQKHHGAIYEKYSDKLYKRASAFVAEEVKGGFALV